VKKQLTALAVVVLVTVGLALGSDWYMHHGKWYAKEPAKDFYVSKLIADIRTATGPYQDIAQAKEDGYAQISGNIPLQGYHFYKAGITQFDYTNPSTLLYTRAEGRWTLIGLEYAFPGEPPAQDPFPGIAWERQLAVCRYADWQEYRSHSREGCPQVHPDTKSAFAAWYPDMWVIRLWLWYPNPYGLFASLNPLLAPFDDRTIPPDETGSWEDWKARTAFSNFNHHFSGWLVLLMGIVMAISIMWGEKRESKLSNLWPIVALGVAAFILYRSDPEFWPFGPRTLVELLGDREVIEHKASGLIILAIGSVEWLRVRGILSHWLWGLLFPGLAIMGGTTLLFHLHPISNFNYLGRNNQPHITEGTTAILAGTTYLLASLKIMQQRWWKLVPAFFIILMGVQLIVYLE
jgi:hypothetical protein